MKTLRSIFGFGRSASRFNRYYGGIVQPGVGYPTADEARRDLIRYDRSTQQFPFTR